MRGSGAEIICFITDVKAMGDGNPAATYAKQFEVAWPPTRIPGKIKRKSERASSYNDTEI